MKKFKLNVVRQTRRNPIYVVLLSMASLWFKKELVGSFIRELDNFVFD